MKTFACICGSPRRNGNSRFCAERVCDRLRASGAEVKSFPLIEHRIKRCIGCRECMRLKKCAIQDDDFQPIMDAVLSADSILLVAPVYWNSPPGIMKDFIDRAHGYYACDGVLRGKSAFLISIAADSGFETHEEIMASWLVCYGAKVQGKLRVLGREKDDVRNDLARVAQIDEFADRIIHS